MASVEKAFSPFVLVIDNETLSKRPDAYITQVGYLVGNVLTGEILEAPRNVNLMTGAPSRAHVDILTVKWWMNQSEEARKAVFNDDQPYSPHSLFQCFKNLVEKYGPGLTVWASPAMFDLPQLTLAWGGAKPWKYSAERDMMTLYKLLDPMGTYQPADTELRHTGAADARWQFNYLVTLMRILLWSSAGADYKKALEES